MPARLSHPNNLVVGDGRSLVDIDVRRPREGVDRLAAASGK